VPASAKNVINVPLSWGSGGREVRAAFENSILPDLKTFAPDLIIVSAGFDAHRDDPLAGLNFLEEDYAWMTSRLVEQAQTSARGRVVSCLEGGYDLDALGRSVVAHARALKQIQ
jgi:acetoin utilization deacetylase AcuC-like enzyme